LLIICGIAFAYISIYMATTPFTITCSNIQGNGA